MGGSPAMAAPGARRAGYLLVEALVAGALLLLLLQVSWWTAASHGRASARLVEEGRLLDQVRLSRHVLTREVRMGPGIRVVDGAMYLRAYRGLGLSCGGEGVEWWVAVSGDRNLAPEKDSVLILRGDGVWAPGRVVRRSRADADRCPVIPGFEAERWTLEAPVDSLWIVRYFESTGYRFSDSAFRMRSGARWQPLTDLSFVDSESGLNTVAGPAIRARVRVQGPLGSARDREWRLWGPS